MLSAPLIIGHRGASIAAPENTLAAFSRALAHGADGIEFDVRLSRDDIPVVIHDDSLKRTGQLERMVNELTATQLQQCEVSNWFNERQHADVFRETVPKLAQVFELLKPTNTISYLEMKANENSAPTLAQKVVDEINASQVLDRIIVSSFDLNAVGLVKQIDRRIRTAALFEPKLSRPLSTIRRVRMIDLALKHRADEIALHHSLVSPRVVHRAQQHGLGVVVWTVDEVRWVQRAVSLGIKALITNDPASLLLQRNSLALPSRTNSAR